MSALATRIAEDFAAATSGTADGPALARRRSALNRLQTTGLPGTRDENWKYASLRGLERLRFLPAPAGATATPDSALPAPVAGFTRYVFVDGRYAPALSAPAAAGFAPLSVHGAPPGSGAHGSDERFALLNEAFATDGAQIRIERGDTAARLELIFLASADAHSGGSYPRVDVAVGESASLELIERHVSAAAVGSFVNSAAVVQLSRGAACRHYRLQELSARTTCFDTLSAQLGPDASYRLHAISLGAAAARATTLVRLAGERAAAGACHGGPGRRASRCRTPSPSSSMSPRARKSAQLFRGIAAARSRVAFNGKVVVARGAAGTDSQQSLRGLLAGPEAEIDVRPQLEIYTDEVRCSHGATAGKLDEQMLFYLLSRGLERDAAQRLLKWAFLEDAVATIEVPELRRQIELSLAGALEDEALKELL